MPPAEDCPGNSIEVPRFIRGLIFDCDGTLADSMPLHMEAWQEALRIHGAKYDYEFFYSKKGMKETEIVELYNKQFHAALSPQEVVSDKHNYFLRHIQLVKPLDAVVDVARRHSGIFPMAVVSGSVREIVTGELGVMGILDLFKAVLTGDDPFKQKPAPDMFLEAARRLGVSPEQCQVFEDADLGLLAARNAGMVATDVRPFLPS
ncbi:MAG TPA: HAD family phosphatase [Bacteroidota bacterium]|nr:HAD family phosphatase [Bacteroidota bacterium]